jgi:hypothetical protein
MSGFGDLFKGVDVDRYQSRICQHCDRPCAIRCECGEVLELDSVHCPECGYVDGDSLDPEECHRIMIFVCSAHASH